MLIIRNLNLISVQSQTAYLRSAYQAPSEGGKKKGGKKSGLQRDSNLLLSNCLNWKIYCDDHTSLSFHTAVQIWIISDIYFTWFHCTGKNELDKLTLLPMCGFIAQLVEHRTGIAEVMGSNPVEALIFFRLLLSNCLNWKIYCDDHTSLLSHIAVQIWIISYIFHMISLHGKKMNSINWPCSQCVAS